MATSTESAAVVALVRSGRGRLSSFRSRVEQAGGAYPLLVDEQGLLAQQLLEEALVQIEAWRDQQIELVTMVDESYPENLKTVEDRPPLLFIAGDLRPDDHRSVAIIGSRNSSEAGRTMAEDIAGQLVSSGYTVNSGLAAGIDTSAHVGALNGGGRTVAVIGTGLEHCYPPQNAPLQRRIANEGAVISQFWPHTPPGRANFPLRNSVMAGLSLATVIVEASATSGARIQARESLNHGRPVILLEPVLGQQWARELSGRPGTYVVSSALEVPALVDRLSAGLITG